MTWASNPTPAIWTKGWPLAWKRSTSVMWPCLMTWSARLRFERWTLGTGIPISLAKTFMVPVGRTPSAVLEPMSPMMTAFRVPSPPAARMTGSSSAANLAASSRASSISRVA